MKSVHFSVDLAFEITLKQHTNFCNQSQTDTCRNNQWLSLDLDCRQTSVISTDKKFAGQRKPIFRSTSISVYAHNIHPLTHPFSFTFSIYLVLHLIWYSI